MKRPRTSLLRFTSRPEAGTRATRIAMVLAAVGVSVSPAGATAQINIETLRASRLPEGHSGSLSGDLTVRTGNVELVTLDLEGRHNFVEGTVATLFVGEGGVGLLGGSRFASSGLLHARRAHRTDARVSPEYFAQLNYDRPKLLTFRALVGSGVRVSAARGERAQLGAGAAVMLEQERLSLPDSALHPRNTTTLRWSSFVSVRAVGGERAVVTSTTYLQPDLRNLGDLRVLENLRVAAPISDALALRVSFDLRYDARPPDGIARLDTTLRTGVTYTYQ